MGYGTVQKIQFSLFFFAAAICASNVKEEEGVLVLTNDNFEDVMDGHDLVLVDFYAPWCGHCQKLAPEYAKAAQQLKKEGSSIKLGKVDCTVEDTLGTQHVSKGYPTLKFFQKKVAKEYTGPRDAEGIVNWLKREAMPKVHSLHTKDDMDEFKKTAPAVVVGFFKDIDSENKMILNDVATDLKYADITVGITSSEDLLKEEKIEDDKIVIFQRFGDQDEKRVDFDALAWDRQAIATWIDAYSLPIVRDFSRKIADRLFKGAIKNHIMLFVQRKADNYKELMEMFEKAAEKFILQMTFVVVDTDSDESKGIMEYLNCRKDEVPTIKIIDLSHPERDLPRYDSDMEKLSAENMEKFIEDYFAGKLVIKRKSEEIPEDWDKEPVKILVGKNFYEVLNKQRKKGDVIVDIYAPWCGHCKELAPTYDELGKYYQDRSKNVTIAKFDGSKNEVEGLKIRGYPTILLFRSDGGVYRFNSPKKALENLRVFVDTRGKLNGEPFDFEMPASAKQDSQDAEPEDAEGETKVEEEKEKKDTEKKKDKDKSDKDKKDKEDKKKDKKDKKDGEKDKKKKEKESKKKDSSKDEL